MTLLYQSLAASSKRPLHDAPEQRHHDQDHELRQVDAAQHGEQFRAHRGRLGSGAVLLVHPRHQFLVAQRWLEATADSFALSQRSNKRCDVVNAGSRANLEQRLVDTGSQAIATKSKSDFLPEDAVWLRVRG